ncbi:14871_t:CDS:2, partial [Gigaspora margarita]
DHFWQTELVMQDELNIRLRCPTSRSFRHHKKGVSSFRQQDSGHGSWNSLRIDRCKGREEVIDINLNGMIFSTNLGGSSKYSNKNFED